MPVADQHQVVHVGRATVRPVHHVVRRRPGHWPVAARPATAAVAHVERAPRRPAHHPPRPPDVDHRRLAIQQHARDGGVARQPLHCRPSNRRRELQLRSGSAAQPHERLQGRRHLQVRPLARPSRHHALVQPVRGQLHQRVGETTSAIAPIIRPASPRQRLNAVRSAAPPTESSIPRTTSAPSSHGSSRNQRSSTWSFCSARNPAASAAWRTCAQVWRKWLTISRSAARSSGRSSKRQPPTATRPQPAPSPPSAPGGRTQFARLPSPRRSSAAPASVRRRRSHPPTRGRSSDTHAASTRSDSRRPARRTPRSPQTRPRSQRTPARADCTSGAGGRGPWPAQPASAHRAADRAAAGQHPAAPPTPPAPPPPSRQFTLVAQHTHRRVSYTKLYYPVNPVPQQRHARATPRRIYARPSHIYSPHNGKHLVDLDEDSLSAARAELGTATIKDTVNQALRQATAARERRIAAALDILAVSDLDDRSDAWR